MLVFKTISRMPRTKIIVAVLVAWSLFVSGCYSYQSITEEERKNLMMEPGVHMEVTLKDGSSLRIGAYKYIYVDTLDEFVYSKGQLYKSPKAIPEDFLGKIHPTRVDSGFLPKTDLWTGRVHYYDYWISESSKVRCKTGDIMHVSGDSIPRLWYRINAETGNIEIRSIEKLEVSKFSMTRTSFFLLGFGLVIGLAVALRGIGDQELNWGEGWPPVKQQ